jgi:SAM-dependent methyltransferase
MTSHSKYFQYLKGRSRFGWLYRRYWLYPRLCKYLNGVTLDVGCGIGDFLRCRSDTIGVDINPETIAWCCREGLNVHLMQPDSLPFQDMSFESAILDNVLEHLSRPTALLREVHRVLQPKSHLVVGVPGLRGYAADPDHKIFYDEAKLVRTLGEAGFRLCKLFNMPLRSTWLSFRIKQYCLYGVFERE